MLATAGGLVFSGGTNDRKFHAFDAATGELLWEFPTSSGVEAPPTSFLIDGINTSRLNRAGAATRAEIKLHSIAFSARRVSRGRRDLGFCDPVTLLVRQRT